jgi:hypothetical protein
VKKDNGDRNKVGMQGGKGKTGISEGRNVRKAVRERRHKSKGTKRRGVKEAQMKGNKEKGGERTNLLGQDSYACHAEFPLFFHPL